MLRNGKLLKLSLKLLEINIYTPFAWRHPDKNKNENAEEKFVEINKAYEVQVFPLNNWVIFLSTFHLLIIVNNDQILSDPTRKKIFDQRGIVEDGPNIKNTHSDHFGDVPSFFHSGGFKFQFKMPEMNFYYQQGITLRWDSETNYFINEHSVKTVVCLGGMKTRLCSRAKSSHIWFWSTQTGAWCACM